ncbi:MAG: response regulator [Gammaproteobacteria bacterium]|nr:response regulator [Gammaproteobacteria bacterium]
MNSILVVDDEQPVCDMIKDMLESEGYEITSSLSADKALSFFKESPHDLVITDMVMPETTGIDLIMRVREIAPKTKILAISGGGGINGRFDYLAVAELLGAQSILKKPFTMSDLRSRVKDILAA